MSSSPGSQSPAHPALCRLCHKRTGSSSGQPLTTTEATPLVERQLAPVRARQQTLAQFATSLEERLELLQTKNAELSKKPAGKRA